MKSDAFVMTDRSKVEALWLLGKFLVKLKLEILAESPRRSAGQHCGAEQGRSINHGALGVRPAKRHP